MEEVISIEMLEDYRKAQEYLLKAAEAEDYEEATKQIGLFEASMEMLVIKAEGRAKKKFNKTRHKKAAKIPEALKQALHYYDTTGATPTITPPTMGTSTNNIGDI